MKNKYCHYTSSRIMTTNIFMIHENVCCHYITACIMKNKYCHYTSSCIRRYTFSCIMKCLLSLYNCLYNEK